MADEKKSIFKKMKSLFIVDDEKANAAPAEQSTESVEPEPEETFTGKIDNKIIKMLKGVLNKKKLEGFEYLQFKEVFNDLELDNEDSKFKAAMATAKTMKSDVDILMTAAKFYLDILSDQKGKAIKTVSEANDEIIAKEKEVDSIQKQIDDLVVQQKSLNAEIEKEKSDTANMKASFDASCQALEDEINADIEKFKKYKK
jgi:hypothetical protein